PPVMPQKTMDQQVSRRELLRLLDIRGEGDDWDFKVTWDPASQQSRVELVKDLFAFANSSHGGHLVFGVHGRTYELVGLEPGVQVDTTEVYKAVSKFNTDFRLAVADYEIQRSGWPRPRRFAILFV